MRVKSFSQNFVSKLPGKLFPSAQQQPASLTCPNLLAKHFSTSADPIANPNLYSESSKLESTEISSILRKRTRTPTLRPTYTSTEDDTIPETPDKLHFAEKTEFDVVKVRVKQFEDVKTLKKIGGVYISKYNEWLENPETRPDNFKHFKYGLPMPNLDPEFKSLIEISDEIFPKAMTGTENLFNMFSIGENTQLSYSGFEDMLVEKFNFEEDMYGEIVSNEKVFGEMVSHFKEDIIPASKLKNNEWMDMVRGWRVMNLNMPGTLENEDPNRFLDLRPVEDFRFLPIVPINDRQINDFKRRLELWHTKKFNFLIKKDDVYNFLVFLIAIGTCWKILSYLMEKDEEMMVDLERTKIARILAS